VTGIAKFSFVAMKTISKRSSLKYMNDIHTCCEQTPLKIGILNNKGTKTRHSSMMKIEFGDRLFRDDIENSYCMKFITFLSEETSYTENRGKNAKYNK